MTAPRSITLESADWDAVVCGLGMAYDEVAHSPSDLPGEFARVRGLVEDALNDNRAPRREAEEPDCGDFPIHQEARSAEDYQKPDADATLELLAALERRHRILMDLRAIEEDLRSLNVPGLVYVTGSQF